MGKLAKFIFFYTDEESVSSETEEQEDSDEQDESSGE